MLDEKQPTKPELLESLRRLSDDELVARLKSLAARERRATALLVAHLAELDTRDLHLRAGYPSLFVYCRDVLALSEHEAYNRMEVARTARRFPLVLDLLASGAVNLTAVRLLGPHLTADNHSRVLKSARGKRKAEVEEIVARLAPRPDVPASVRKLPIRTVSAAPAVDSCLPGADSCSSGRDSCSPGADLCLPGADPAAPPNDGVPVRAESSPSLTGCPRGLPEQPPAAAAPPAPHGASAALTPLSPDRYRYQLTIGGATLEKLRLAKDMLRHALPSGDDEALLDRALSLLLDDLARRKFGSEESARTSREAAKHSRDVRRNTPKDSRDVRVAVKDSRHVPVAVKRAVWVRDVGRCAFVAEDGRRCGERAFVEFHHLHPYAAGGQATVSNIQLRCREHNGYEARLFFPRPEDRLIRSGTNRLRWSGAVQRDQTIDSDVADGLAKVGREAKRRDAARGPAPAPRRAMLL